MNYFILCITKKYADFNGRARRMEFGMYLLISFLLGILISVLGITVMGIIWLNHLASLLLLVPSVAVYMRRLHDLNMSGWWIIPFYIMPTIYFYGMLMFYGIALGTNLIQFYEVAGVWFIMYVVLSCVSFAFLIYLIFKEGDPYPNQYGDDPKKEMHYQQGYYQQNNFQNFQQPQGNGFNQWQNNTPPQQSNFGGYQAPQQPQQQGGFYNGGHNAGHQSQRPNPAPQQPQSPLQQPPRKNNGGDFNGDLYGKAK